MIRVSHISKHIQNQIILDDINFDVENGEILVVLGESGAGKSVLLKHLIGLLKPDQGHIYIDEQDITLLTEDALLGVRKNMGYMFQEGALYDFMNVSENLAFPLKEHTKLNDKAIEKKVQELLLMVGLEDASNKYPSELSGGMRKRVGLARAMIMDTKILLCDEPTSGLDPIRSRDISNLIRDVSRKFKCTTVIASHDIDNAFRIADRLALIQQGKIVAIGTPKDLQASSNHFVKEFINT